MKIFPHFPKVSFALIIICFLLPFVTVKCDKYEIARLNGIDMVTGYEVGADSDQPREFDPNLFILGSLVMAVAGLVMAFLKFKGNAIASLVVSVLGLAALVYFYFDIRQNIPTDGTVVIIISMGIGYYFSTIGFLLNSLFFGYQLSFKKEVFEAEIKKVEPE
ncbi:MAG TPA: hypothetical protein PLA88_02325 [Bacteroidales bacterium]|nr:hypothetical protein [Bacteroidales bacterium]